MRNRSLDAGGVTLAIILGLFTGPLLIYALSDDAFHTLNLPSAWRGQGTPHIIAAAAAVVLIVLALFSAARFRNSGVAGAITGVAAGVGELAVATVPWLAAARTIHCDPGHVCPLPSQPDLIQIALTVGIFYTVLFGIAGYSLALLTHSVRHRLS